MRYIDIALNFEITIVSNVDIALADFYIYQNGNNYWNIVDKTTTFSVRLCNDTRKEG